MLMIVPVAVNDDSPFVIRIFRRVVDGVEFQIIGRSDSPIFFIEIISRLVAVIFFGVEGNRRHYGIT